MANTAVAATKTTAESNCSIQWQPRQPIECNPRDANKETAMWADAQGWATSNCPKPARNKHAIPTKLMYVYVFVYMYVNVYVHVYVYVYVYVFVVVVVVFVVVVVVVVACRKTSHV